MPTLPNLTEFLSEFIGSDLSRSFWNGGGKVTILAKSIVEAIQTGSGHHDWCSPREAPRGRKAAASSRPALISTSTRRTP